MRTSDNTVDTAMLARLLAEAKASGGSELANTQPFLIGLCRALGLDEPAFSSQHNDRNDYVFERRVTFKFPDGTTSPDRIDLYKRGCFVLESKQSSLREARKDRDQLNLQPEDALQVKQGTAGHRRLGPGNAGGAQPGGELRKGAAGGARLSAVPAGARCGARA